MIRSVGGVHGRSAAWPGGRAVGGLAGVGRCAWQDERVDTVPISDDVIRLGQFLKLANLAESGADARTLIENGDVRVNGEVEQRRGRQLRRGDRVEVDAPTGTDGAEVG